MSFRVNRARRTSRAATTPTTPTTATINVNIQALPSLSSSPEASTDTSPADWFPSCTSASNSKSNGEETNHITQALQKLGYNVP